MSKTFRDALLEALEATGVTLRRVSTDTGVSYEQLKKLRQRELATTNVEDAKLVANYFGYSLDEFLGDRTIEDRAEIVRLYSQLSPRERAILRASSTALADPDRTAD